MKTNRTEYEIDKIISARAETVAIIEKEMKYLPQHQDQKYLATFNTHLAKLDAMLAEVLA